MSLNELETHVLKLNDFLNDRNHAQICSAIISDIVFICGENIGSQTISYCLSLFFKRDKNLLTFLRKAIPQDELQESKAELLQFLYRFTVAAGNQIIDYASEIKDTCMSIFNTEKYSKVRCCTFPLISKVLEVCSTNSDIIANLNIEKLANDYFLALVNQSKLTSTSNILAMLGLICRYFPESLQKYSDKCLNLFLNTLKAEMSTKNLKPDLQAIAGALEGLNNYLYNFTQSVSDGSKYANDIFNFTKQALLSNTEVLSKFPVPTAALDLLAKHAQQFNELIYKEYVDLFDRISQWTKHRNRDIKKVAYIAMDSYYKQLAEMIKIKAKAEPDKCKTILKSFLQRFYKNLKNDSNLKESIISIKGYGAFAGACKEFLEAKDLKVMFNIIIELCERVFFIHPSQDQQEEPQQINNYNEKIYQLPIFIESLANICNQIDDRLPEGNISTLEKLIILTIESYPRLNRKNDYQIIIGLAQLFIAIQIRKSELYPDFVSRIVYQSMIRIFSYKTNYFFQQDQLEQIILKNENTEEEIENENEEKDLFAIKCTDFVMLWSNLLNITESKELNSLGIHINDRKKLVVIIYDSYIETLIKIVNKLDLNSVKLDSYDEKDNNQNTEINLSSNPVAGLRPTKPKDLEILINLVDFSRELLLQKQFDLFEKWIYKLSKEVILLSTRYSLISGFYKLASLCMKISIKIKYFSNLNEEDEQSTMSFMADSYMDTTTQESNLIKYEKTNCLSLYEKFIKEVCIRMKQFKDELLASSLEFLISLPKQLTINCLDEVFQALKMSLEMGINYLPIADNALASLEYWFNTIPLDRLKPYYSMILNKLDDYLQMNKSGNIDESVVEEKILSLKLNKKEKSYRKLPVKTLDKNALIENPELYEKVQFKILKILGQLAGEMSHCLFETNLNDQILSWDTNQHLKFYVPFVDMKPTIYFDQFLPRIIYLALSSTNRPTKVNACELLHAIVVYMIGKSVTDPVAMQSSLSSIYQMNKLYNHIYPALFKLACDVDHFARNLFYPLVLQLIHWFTGNRKYESFETIELLNCIMDGLIDEKDASLRDFSAMALGEFLKWSIKHTPLAAQDSATNVSPVNVKSILKRIFNFLVHPSSSKRLGAALAWNSIYAIFREEESLVDKHIFEILYYLVESLAYAEKDDKLYGTQEQCKKGLDHVERIIKVKSDVLNQQNINRIKPPGWAMAIMEVAVRWLMRQCGRIETECRHKSMELVYKLAPCVNGIKETKTYFQLRLESEGEAHFLARFEGSNEKKEILKDSLFNYPILTDLNIDNLRQASIQTWLDMLLAPLDCYSWVFSEKLLTPADLFKNQKSCVWRSLKYFIDNFLNYDLEDLLRKVCNISSVCTPAELDQYRGSKCTTLIRFIDFLLSIINTDPRESVKIIPDDIWCETFFASIINMCIDPEKLGFDVNDLEVFNNLPHKTRAILKTFSLHLPMNIQKRIKDACQRLIDADKLCQKVKSIKKIKGESGNSIEWLKLSQIINGYEQLSEFNLYHVPMDINKEIFDYLIELSNKNETSENLSCLEAKRKLFGLCLYLNSLSSTNTSKANSKNDYLLFIIERYLNDNEKSMTNLFSNYKNEIYLWLCKKHDSIIKLLFNKINESFVKCSNLLIGLLEFIAFDKQIRKSYGSKIVNVIYDNWNLLSNHWNSDNIEKKNILLNLLIKTVLIESTPINNSTGYVHISEMYMSLLVDNSTNLSFKCKLLDLLYFFCDSPAPYLAKTYLNKFVSQLAFKSSELVEGDEAYDDYLNAIRKLLISLELSSSIDLLNIIVNIACRESKHICDTEIQQTLSRFIKRMDSAKQTSVISSYWDSYFKKSNESIGSSEDRKYYTFQKVILNFLNNCDKPVFLDFMCLNINYLIKILEVDLKEDDFYGNCIDNKCAFEIIELAYKRLHKDEIFYSNAKLCITYETGRFGQVKDGKELTKEVLKKSRKHQCEEIRVLSSFEGEKLAKYKEILRETRCAAYNCLISLFIRTQTEPKLYFAFLFKDDAGKKEFTFEPLIDNDKKYKFPIELENLTERRTKLVSLRNEFYDPSSEIKTDSKDVNYIKSLQATNTLANQGDKPSYIGSQNLYESSLSEELSVFDFNGSNSHNKMVSSLSGTIGSFEFSSRPGLYKRKSSNFFNRDHEEANKFDSPVEIELDDLNQHESMSQFVELVQSLVINKITPIFEKGHLPTDMPPWMAFLHKKVSDISTHENVKLFIIRGIINTKQVFKSYASFWYAPLLAFIVNSSLSREESIDYFTLDLMVLLLSWHSVSLPQENEKKLVNRTLENLMRRCYHDNRSILRNNLQLLKTMAECWKNLLEVPVGIINSLLNSSEKKKMEAGIQLFGVILSNNISEYNFPNEISSIDLYKSIVRCMKHTYKDVYASSAEVVGMLFRKIESDEEVLNDCAPYLFEVLRDLKLESFITCIHRIQLNYVPISERFMSKLLFNLPKLHGEFKLLCAESILSSIKKLEDPLFSTSAFMDMISHRNSSLQLVSLKMVHELLDKLSEEELNRLLPIVCNFISHPSSSCRYQMLLILMDLHERFQYKISDTSSTTIKKLTNETLLKALLDSDQTIRIMSQNFWAEKAHIPTNTIERMILILGKMYSPQTEAEYLSYSTNLLLEKTSKSPDYNKLIFENPLSECTFRDYNLSADWRRRYEMMTPLFVDTISSLTSDTNEAFKFNQGAFGNNLRATQQQSLQFQPTQDLGNSNNKRMAYNWLTQSSVNTQSSFSMPTFTESQSSLLFSTSRALGKSSSKSNESETDILRLRRRFFKSTTEMQSKFFGKKQIEKKSKEIELKRQEKLKRSSQVEKYRQYRIGDFPDIQIKYAELIAPLQALAQRDSQLAMTLFDSLFVSILSEISYMKDDSESYSIIKEIETNLNSILASSDSYNPNLIACILQISVKHAKSFKLDPKLISTASLNSLQQPIGILLLEEYLILSENNDEGASESTQPKVKKMRMSNEPDIISDQSIIWIELAKLYRSMNDYDSIKGIFTRKANLTSQYTKDAFEFESNNDYHQARKCYMDALNEEEEPVTPVQKLEHELWEESLLRCCKELTDWKAMYEWSVGDDDLKSLVNGESYTEEHKFPYALRSKLKLIMQEDVDEQKKHADLIQFLHGLDTDSKKFIEHSFSFEMALINLHQRDINAAKYYSQLAIQKFLIEWSSINKTITQARMTKLQSLQSIVELSEFLKFIDSNPTYTPELNWKIKSMVDLWTNTMPNFYSDPPCTWDDIITNRCMYYEFIEDKYFSSSSDEDVDMTNSIVIDKDNHDFNNKSKILDEFKKSKMFMKIKFAEAALHQGNFKLTLNKLQSTKMVTKIESNEFSDLKINWMHCYLKTHLARSKILNSPQESMNVFLGALSLKEILKYDNLSELKVKKKLNLEHQLLHGQFSRFLIDSFLSMNSELPNYLNEISRDDKKKSQLLDYTKSKNINDSQDLVSKIMKHGISSLIKTNTDESKASLELANYCDYFLRLVENETSDNLLTNIKMIKEEFPQIVVKQLLNAIRFNSYEARQRFPRLLQIVELYNDQTLKIFIESSENVPSWMFIGWLSQITALLDKPEAKAVYNIVEKITNDYPQAIVYPFKMSMESFKFDYKTQEQKEFVMRLKTKIDAIPLVNQFIGALDQLTNPASIFKDYLDQINTNIKNRDALYKIIQEMYSSIIEDSSFESQELVEWGNIRKKFSKHMKPKFDAEFGANFQLMSGLSENAVIQKFRKLNSEVDEYSRTVRDGNLGEYSPWLKSYKRNIAKDLEIPGQYTGKSKPTPEYHIKIESFDERVMVLNSLRKPKCITIRGNDQKDHKFLLKGGEDQRQDQRIQTLFELINDLLRADPRCYQRNLSIKTYQVIPMTTKLSLIEWLPDTKTLKEAIFDARSEDEIRRMENSNKYNPDYVYHEYTSEIGKENNYDKYGSIYAKYSRDYVIEKFKKIQELTPWDLLRRFIRSMASSTEGYFVLRNQFIISYAVASACQYILGIGDRHLSNWLIDLKSGKAIGIDFGMAFGYSTMNLSVPELMPIRLTRQILKVIAPLEQNGLFEASMLHTIRALRTNNDLLMCILDVFIKEPSIDWIGNAKRIAKRYLDEDTEYTMGVEYAKSRVNSAKNKLDGINPCVITRIDLMSGIHKDSKFLPHFVKVLLGEDAVDEKSNYMMERTKILKDKGEKYKLSIEEQVRCIIEQATDPNILGRTYIGWQPYV